MDFKTYEILQDLLINSLHGEAIIQDQDFRLTGKEINYSTDGKRVIYASQEQEDAYKALKEYEDINRAKIYKGFSIDNEIYLRGYQLVMDY